MQLQWLSLAMFVHLYKTIYFFSDTVVSNQHVLDFYGFNFIQCRAMHICASVLYQNILINPLQAGRCYWNFYQRCATTKIFWLPQFFDEDCQIIDFWIKRVNSNSGLDWKKNFSKIKSAIKNWVIKIYPRYWTCLFSPIWSISRHQSPALDSDEWVQNSKTPGD